MLVCVCLCVCVCVYVCIGVCVCVCVCQRNTARDRRQDYLKHLCVAVSCSVLQCVAACSVLQCVAVCVREILHTTDA